MKKLILPLLALSLSLLAAASAQAQSTAITKYTLRGDVYGQRDGTPIYDTPLTMSTVLGYLGHGEVKASTAAFFFNGTALTVADKSGSPVYGSLFDISAATDATALSSDRKYMQASTGTLFADVIANAEIYFKYNEKQIEFRFHGHGDLYGTATIINGSFVAEEEKNN